VSYFDINFELFVSGYGEHVV